MSCAHAAVRGAQLEMPAGSISVHHTRTLHGSSLNTSGDSRRMLFFQYAAVDAWPLGGERALLPSSLTIPSRLAAAVLVIVLMPRHLASWA